MTSDYKRQWNKQDYAKRKEFHKERTTRRKREMIEWLWSLKDGKACNRCGFSDPRALEYHHTGKKNFNISLSIRLGYSREKILKEIEGTELICANCHKIEHSPR